MIEWLKCVLSRIADDTMLPHDYYVALDCNSALNSRDTADFSAEWMRLFHLVKDTWEATSIQGESGRLAEDIRRESFLAVSRATGQHEIASYVSDDFELLVKSRLLGITAPMLEAMWSAYEAGRFPSLALVQDQQRVSHK